MTKHRNDHSFFYLNMMRCIIKSIWKLKMARNAFFFPAFSSQGFADKSLIAEPPWAGILSVPCRTKCHYHSCIAVPYRYCSAAQSQCSKIIYSRSYWRTTFWRHRTVLMIMRCVYRMRTYVHFSSLKKFEFGSSTHLKSSSFWKVDSSRIPTVYYLVLSEG